MPDSSSESIGLILPSNSIPSSVASAAFSVIVLMPLPTSATARWMLAVATESSTPSRYPKRLEVSSQTSPILACFSTHPTSTKLRRSNR